MWPVKTIEEVLADPLARWVSPEGIINLDKDYEDGERAFAPFDLLDTSYTTPRSAAGDLLTEEHQKRAVNCDMELKRDGMLQGGLGELLRRPQSKVLILAGPSRSGKTCIVRALENVLRNRHAYQSSAKKQINRLLFPARDVPSRTQDLVKVPWLTLRPARENEKYDKWPDRIQISPELMERIISEDFDRENKRIAIAANLAYNPYILLNRAPVEWGLPRNCSLEAALRNDAMIVVDCFPEVGIALKRILPAAHLVLVMSRDTKSASYPRPHDAPGFTEWRQKHSDNCWHLLNKLWSVGRPHWMLDSVLLPPLFNPDSELGDEAIPSGINMKALEQRLKFHNEHIIGASGTIHCNEIYMQMDPSFGRNMPSDSLTEVAMQNYPVLVDLYHEYVDEARRQRQGKPLPPPEEDPTLEIIEDAFGSLPEWGLLCPGRRQPRHWKS